MTSRDFDIAVSFAGEDRQYVADVLAQLTPGVKVFYDEEQVVQTWGEDLVEFFTELYQNRAHYVVMFISRHYAEKMWPRVERRAALSRAVAQREAYILPVRLDDSRLGGLLPTLGYVDANRLGISGLARALEQKVATVRPIAEAPEASVHDGTVPLTPEALAAVLTERPSLWEYLSYAGMLRQGVDALEPKYRDFIIRYAPTSGKHVDADTLSSYAKRALAALVSIVDNFEVVLDEKVQEAAFGAPGEPGDPDRIAHMATRFVSVYEDFMDWAANLRGTTTDSVEAGEALKALARYADQPIDKCRTFVSDFVAQIETVQERMDAGERVEIIMPVQITLDESLSADFYAKMERALLLADE